MQNSFFPESKFSQEGRHPSFMTPEERDQWNRLCDEAAKEQDPQRLTHLMSEIYRMLHKERSGSRRRTLAKLFLGLLAVPAFLHPYAQVPA